MKYLTGKVAVVTGGASGIGLAMATAFLQEGMSVVVADIEEPALGRALDELGNPSSVLGVVTDVRSRDSVQNLADHTIARFGRVDVVCNNAGVESGGSFLSVPEQTWRWVMDVNFFGVLHGCQVFLPILAEQEEAHIVNTASVAAFASGSPTMTPYCASKFAVLGMSESLAAELRDSGSRVGITLLAPGPVRTRMTAADRNRPSDVPAAQEPTRLAVIADLERRTTESGLDPSAVAALVVESVRENRFFALPHPEMALNGLHRRLDWMETGQAPPPRIPGS